MNFFSVFFVLVLISLNELSDNENQETRKQHGKQYKPDVRKEKVIKKLHEEM